MVVTSGLTGKGLIVTVLSIDFPRRILDVSPRARRRKMLTLVILLCRLSFLIRHVGTSMKTLFMRNLNRCKHYIDSEEPDISVFTRIVNIILTDVINTVPSGKACMSSDPCSVE